MASDLSVMDTPRRRYIARGDTYRHREELTAWAWHWDAKRHAWVEDNGSEPDEHCIQAIRHLPGVTVTEESVDEDE